MKFNIPYALHSRQSFISPKIQIKNIENTDNGTNIQSIQSIPSNYYTVITKVKLCENEVILIEYPFITLYGEYDIDRGLQMLMKYIMLADTPEIKNLYPRLTDYYTFPHTPLIMQIHKIIKQISNSKTNKHNKYNKLDKHNKHSKSTRYIENTNELIEFFNKYTNADIEFYYAKYIFNAFDGFSYGPLALQYLSNFNHSCNNNNISFEYDKLIGAMIVKTIKAIEPNQELYISYLLNKTIDNHKEYLYTHYGFNCCCK